MRWVEGEERIKGGFGRSKRTTPSKAPSLQTERTVGLTCHLCRTPASNRPRLFSTLTSLQRIRAYCGPHYIALRISTLNAPGIIVWTSRARVCGFPYVCWILTMYLS